MRLAENTGRKTYAKIAICPPSHNFVGLYLRNECMDRQSEKLLNSNIFPTCPHNNGELRPTSGRDLLASLSLGHPSNFNGYRVLAALLHSTLVESVSQTLRRRTEGATYIPQGGHHVGHSFAHVLV